MQIVFYRDKHGEEPVRDFLNSLCPKMRAIVLRTIKLLADNGYKLIEPTQNIYRMEYLNYASK